MVLLGRGGSKIKEIQEESGARVRVSLFNKNNNNNNNNIWSILTMVGYYVLWYFFGIYTLLLKQL